MPNSKKPSDPPFGSYLWFKQVEAKHQDDFEGWPASKKAASSIGPEPKRYSAEWFDWVETRDWIQGMKELGQEQAMSEKYFTGWVCRK